MRTKLALLILAVSFAGCSKKGQYFVDNETIYCNKAMFSCYRGYGVFTANERLAYCETAKECEEICSAARSKGEAK